MRHRSTAALLVCFLLFTWGGAATAQEDARFLFGLESRFGDGYPSTVDTWTLIPNFSYHLTPRLRLDAFTGFSWTDSGSYIVNLQPGLRYYLRPPRGKLRFNSGFSLGFDIIEHRDGSERERLAALGLYADRDPFWVRAVPIELEYWEKQRWGLTFALDYQSRVNDARHDNEDGFGLAAGLRFRIR
jgi:hypothetical protein